MRVRATNASGTGAASAEVVLTVGSACATPGAPSGLAVTSSAGGVVVLTWTAASGSPTSYIVEAGSAPGLTNLANSDLGGSTASLRSTGVGEGTYYVRVRARTPCGVGAVSNEVVLNVS